MKLPLCGIKGGNKEMRQVNQNSGGKTVEPLGAQQSVNGKC